MLPAIPSHCVPSIHAVGAQQEPEWAGVSPYKHIQQTVGYAKHEGSQHPYQVTFHSTQRPGYKPEMDRHTHPAVPCSINEIESGLHKCEDQAMKETWR